MLNHRNVASWATHAKATNTASATSAQGRQRLRPRCLHGHWRTKAKNWPDFTKHFAPIRLEVRYSALLPPIFLHVGHLHRQPNGRSLMRSPISSTARPRIVLLTHARKRSPGDGMRCANPITAMSEDEDE
jgi:hypothetical protein